MTTIKNLNDQTTLINLEFHIISGSKKLDPKDLNLPEGVVLPPQTVASLGSKHFISRDELKKFNNLRNEAQTICKSYGVSFMGGFAVPKERLKQVVSALDIVVETFNKEVIQFVQNYDLLIQNFANANPDWKEVILKAVPERTYVSSFMSATFTAFQLGVTEGFESSLESKANGLSASLFEDVSDMTKGLIKSLNNQDSKVGVTQKATWYISNITDKLKGLAFLDNSITPVIRYLDSQMALLPMTGRLSGESYMLLQGLASLLSDPSGDAIKRVALGMSNISTLPSPTLAEVETAIAASPAIEVAEQILPVIQVEEVNEVVIEVNSHKPLPVMEVEESPALPEEIDQAITEVQQPFVEEVKEELPTAIGGDFF